MKVTVNDEVRELPSEATLQILLVDLGLETRRGLAVAVNQSIVSLSERTDHELTEGDRVLIIEAAQGG